MYDVVTNTLRRMPFQRSFAPRRCAHLGTPDVQAPDPASCRPCEEQGERWLKLRMCQTCGTVGCCDSSAGHARAHFEATAHPLIRSIEPGETWAWCYVDGAYLEDEAYLGTASGS